VRNHGADGIVLHSLTTTEGLVVLARASCSALQYPSRHRTDIAHARQIATGLLVGEKAVDLGEHHDNQLYYAAPITRTELSVLSPPQCRLNSSN
jgi:hypothetical protein